MHECSAEWHPTIEKCVPGNPSEDTSETVGGTSPTISVDIMGVGVGVSGTDTGASIFSASADDR